MKEISMETNPEPQLVTMRCPCDDPNPCCSHSVTSPSGLVTLIIWECKAFTEEDIDKDLFALFNTMNDAFSATTEDDGDGTT